MGRVSEAIFKNRTKKNKEESSSEVDGSVQKETRESLIDVDHSESTAPIDSDRSGYSSASTARDSQNLGSFSNMYSVDSAQQSNEAYRRWSFGADINIAKMSGPGFFKNLTTLEAMDANSDEEDEDGIYYTTEDRREGDDPKNETKKSSRVADEPTSPQGPSEKSGTKGGKKARKSKSPHRKKKAKEVDDQPSDSASTTKQKKKKKKGKGQKSKKDNTDAVESPIASDTKGLSNGHQLAAFQLSPKGTPSTNSSGHAADAKILSPSADFQKLFAFQRKMKGSTSTNQKDEHAAGTKKSSNQGYQSFADIEKLSSFQRKGNNNKSGKGTKKEGSAKVGSTGGDNRQEKTATPSPFADFFNNSLYQSVESFIRSPNSKTRKGHEPEDPGSPAGQQPGGDPGTLERTEEIDGKKLKQIAVARIRAFTTVRHNINQQRQFLAALEDEGTKDDSSNPENTNDDDVKDRESIKPNKRESYQKLETELQKYDSMLEMERAELSKQMVTMQLKQHSVEQLLIEEARKNNSLQLRIRQLEVQLENSHDLEEENLALHTQVDLLQQQNAQHKEKISKMMTFQKSEVKRSSNPSLENYLMEGAASESQISARDLDEQSGFASMASMSSKAQGELLKLRSSMRHQNLVCQEQSEELAEVKQELESFKEQQGVKKLEMHVKHLEDEKKFFVAEIEKLQKELAAARNKVNYASSTSPPPAPPAEFNNGRWISTLIGNTGPKAEEKSISTVATSNGSNHSISHSQACPIIAAPKTTLSGVLNDL